MLSHILLTPPSVEPVTLAEMKAHARLTTTADDTLLEGLLRAARQWCEHYTRRAFIHQTWDLALGQAPAKRFQLLPRAPLASITAVHLYDEEDRETLWEASNYYADVLSEPGRLVLRRGASWPEIERCASGMVITYVAGYGASGSAVPEEIKLAIMQLALHWYEYRGEAINATMATKAPLTIEALLHAYRIYDMGGRCA